MTNRFIKYSVCSESDSSLFSKLTKDALFNNSSSREKFPKLYSTALSKKLLTAQ